MKGITEGFDRIIVETDEENPVTIAEITEDEIIPADGSSFRLRGLCHKHHTGEGMLCIRTARWIWR